MERLEKKRIKDNTYYYYSKWGRVNGKSRRLWQKYLGKLDDILHAVEGRGPRPQCAEVFRFGLAATLWQACQRANIIAHVDRHCPKREQGLSTGEYLALAALNRAIDPQSKSAMFDWFANTTLRRHFPHASKAALASQRFWDHMARLDPPLTRAIWKDVITDVMAHEALDLSSVCYDGTNFYTFIDTFNGRCNIAKRDKNKQGRVNLRQVSYALFCQAETQVPLYYEVYEGNRHDTKQFPVMIEHFQQFLTDAFGATAHVPQLTLIFDKGNNSKDNFGLIDILKLHYVGSIKLSEVKALAEISNQHGNWTACQTLGLEKTKCFRVMNQLSDTYLGKNIIITDRAQWNDDQIILAYRSQFHIENVFKSMKDRDIGSWWPLYHWTDQKINVHSFYCTIAVLLKALAHRRVQEAGIDISMKRLLAELDDIKEVVVLYPRKRGAKTAPQHTVLSKTSELQQSLLSILHVKPEEMVPLG